MTFCRQAALRDKRAPADTPDRGADSDVSFDICKPVSVT